MFFLRRISGQSMMPALRPDMIVVAQVRRKGYESGDIVVFIHDGIEKIKRIGALRGAPGAEEMFVKGDNMPSSTDSQSFGWLPTQIIRGKIIWTVPISTILFRALH